MSWASATRLATFAALAAFATAHWATLVEAPPAGRLVLAVGAIVAGAVLLELIRHARPPRALARALAAAAGLLATALGLAAVGISLGLLWPLGWGELGSNLDHGLAGLAGSVEYPYGDDNEWSRLVILAGAPLALGVAATLAFWPVGAGATRRLHLAGLAVLIAMYAIATAANSPDAPLLRGVLLLALVAAWLWLPAIRWREALVAAALIAIAGAIAVPAAAKLDADDPWLDYKGWTLRAAPGTTYEWEHSYGPIDWSRDGTQLLTVSSDKPHYWKTVVLDRFDGVRWRRSEQGASWARDVAGRVEGDGRLPRRRDRDWVSRFRVTVGNLTSDVLVGAGTPLRVQGRGGVVSAPDGTVLARDEPLENGDSYTVTAYVPDPSADRMRAAPEAYPASLMRYTQLELPTEQGGNDAGFAHDRVTVPLRGHADDRVERRLANSPYDRVYALTHRLIDGQPTTYDAVRAIQDHLRSEYDYSEVPPQRTYPLAAFLFEDRIGYCQQFSGAMALMLRMAGIPSRVVSGFAPGSRDAESGAFRVEDFDAHSWVEVYFNEIGWVTFEPTPSTAPALAQQVPAFPTAETEEQRPDGEVERGELASPPGGIPGTGGSGGSSTARVLLAAPVALLALFALAAALVAARTARHRRLPPAVVAKAQLAELGKALERCGWRTSDGATLLGMERRLRRSRGRAASRYVARLRAIRYAPDGGLPPSLAERRALRRELSSAQGIGGRLRALVAIPPGGPRVPRHL